MNDEDINRAIAEHLGWTDIRVSALWEDHQVLCGLNPRGNTRAVPNYCCDLNAMHEAEKTMTERQYWEFADLRLKETVWKHGSPGKAYQCATARQRAEAFLRTVGKWRGEE